MKLVKSTSTEIVNVVSLDNSGRITVLDDALLDYIGGGADPGGTNIYCPNHGNSGCPCPNGPPV